MSKQRINGAKAFVWQVVQACLRDQSIPQRFKGMMMYSSMTMGDDEQDATALVLVCISGAPCEIQAELSVHRDSVDGPWESGSCDLYTIHNPNRIWRFTASVEDHQIKAELTGHPDLAELEYVFASPGPNGPYQHD